MEASEPFSPSPAPSNSDMTTKILLTLISLQGTSQVFRYIRSVWVEHIAPYPVNTYMVMMGTVQIATSL